MSNDRIRIYDENPFYFQFKEIPVLLLGGSKIDCAFQLTDAEQHLDELAAIGGNYIRCTMSARADGCVWPYDYNQATGMFDLSVWNEEYWQRFDRFLNHAAKLDVIVDYHG